MGHCHLIALARHALASSRRQPPWWSPPPWWGPPPWWSPPRSDPGWPTLAQLHLCPILAWRQIKPAAEARLQRFPSGEVPNELACLLAVQHGQCWRPDSVLLVV